MRLRQLFVFSAFALVFTPPAFSQEDPAAPPSETPRQALIQMFSGGHEAFMKHLTLDVQAKSKDPDNSGLDLHELGHLSDGETFDTGPVLYAYRSGREGVEVRVNSERLSGDDAEIRLSVHQTAQQDNDISEWLTPNFVVAMKRQEGIWRLNKITAFLEVPVGDPEFFSFVAKQLTDHSHTTPDSGSSPTSAPGAAPISSDPAPESLLDLIASAEQVYAVMHPEVGFTCSLPDLVDASQTLGVLDPQIAKGSIGGYNFSLKGCSSRPSGSFQAFAEPVNGGAKAFCIDATHNVRTADDGSGETCVSSGKFPKRSISAETD